MLSSWIAINQTPRYAQIISLGNNELLFCTNNIQTNMHMIHTQSYVKSSGNKSESKTTLLFIFIWRLNCGSWRYSPVLGRVLNACSAKNTTWTSTAERYSAVATKIMLETLRHWGSISFGENTVVVKESETLSHNSNRSLNLYPIWCFQQLLNPLWRVLKRQTVSTNSPKSLSSAKNHLGISTAAHCKKSNWDAHRCSYIHINYKSIQT